MSQIDLNTVLLTIVLAISGWTLTTVLRHVKSLTQIEHQLWGKDGRNGHTSDIRLIKSGLARVEKGLHRIVRRIERLEERSGVHEKHHDDEPEDDRRDDSEG